MHNATKSRILRSRTQTVYPGCSISLSLNLSNCLEINPPFHEIQLNRTWCSDVRITLFRRRRAKSNNCVRENRAHLREQGKKDQENSRSLARKIGLRIIADMYFRRRQRFILWRNACYVRRESTTTLTGKESRQAFLAGEEGAQCAPLRFGSLHQKLALTAN
jgi:hypothetical protein